MSKTHKSKKHKKKRARLPYYLNNNIIRGYTALAIYGGLVRGFLRK